MGIGIMIRQQRDKKNISQNELAAVVGRSQQAIDSWEHDRSKPSAEAIKILAAYFGVTTDYLMGQSDVPHSAYPQIDNKDIRIIARAGRHMTPENAETLRKFAQFLDPEAFKKSDE
ncbi:MAG: helix-turn-helix domain-containing protein [Defluviitaleaceae bacterium]|nr:helix-turn-helix domain-containing protein [Defluviitaleaceae bacterium]